MSHERDDVKIFFGQSVRAYENGLVEGYLVPFTGPDQKDYYQTYFDAKTDYGFDHFPVVNAPALYQHGGDATLEVRGLGRVTQKRIDDVGLWIQAQLDLKDDYEKAVHALARRGVFSWSSGALPQSVKQADDGHMERWYIVEASLTPTPGTPAERTKISTVRSLPPLPSLRELMTTVLAKGDDGTSESDRQVIAVPPTENTDAGEPAEREVIMTPEEIKALVMALLTEMGLAPMAEREEVAVVEEVKEELVRMDSPAELDEEQMRSLAKFAVGAINKQREARQATLRGIAASAVEDARNAPGLSKVKAVGSRAAEMAQTARAAMGGNGGSNISVGEESRFAHLSDTDLAVAHMMANVAPVRSLRGIDANRNFMEAAERTLQGRFDKSVERGKVALDTVRAVRSAMFAQGSMRADIDNTQTVGAGEDWVGTFYASDVWQRVRESRVYSLLKSKGMLEKEVPRGSNTAKFPSEGSDPIAFGMPESTQVDSTGKPETVVNINTFGTLEVEGTVGDIGIATAYTFRLDEDSIVDLAPQVNYQLTEKAAETIDQLLLNGDTTRTVNTNINYIDGGVIPGGIQSPYWTVQNGMRKLPLVTNTAKSFDAGNLVNIDTFLQVLSLMPNAIRQHKDRMVFLIDGGVEMAALSLPEILTESERGGMATVIGGQIMKIWGVDVVTAGFIPQTNAAGKVSVTDSNNTRGTILLPYAPYWGVGFKRAFNIEIGRDIYSQSNVYIGTMRMTIVNRSNDAAAIAYNVRTRGV